MTKRRSRTITMTDETFDGLKAIAEYRRYKGEKVSASEILEELAIQYISKYPKEIQIIQDGKSAMNEKIESSLF